MYIDFLHFPNRGNVFAGNTIVVAYINAMCSTTSVGVVQDNHYLSVSTGSNFARGMGLLFDMPFDNG